MAVVTLGIISWATPLYGEAVAPHDGRHRVLAGQHLVRARDSQRGPARSFSTETLENPTLLKAGGLAFMVTVAATELGLLNRLLDTVNLSTETSG